MFRFRTMLSLSAGYAAGYVAGAKAGRPAYDRIMTKVNRYADDLGLSSAQRMGEDVLSSAQQATMSTAAKIHNATDTATDKANEEIVNLRDKVREGGASGRPEEGRQQAPTVTPTP